MPPKKGSRPGPADPESEKRGQGQFPSKKRGQGQFPSEKRGQGQFLPEKRGQGQFPSEEPGQGEFSASEETIEVSQEATGARLDRFLAERYPARSRSALQKMIRKGLVRLDGQTVKPGEPLRAGERIDLSFPPAPPSVLVPEPIPLTILHEDEDILVLDKPAGLVVHPGAGAETGTLVHALVARVGGLSGIGGPRRPGIVHRLDRGTSGLMVVARTDRAHLSLTAQFREREVSKVYLALVWGRMRESEGVVDTAIGRDPVHRRKMSVRAPRGRAAISRYRVVEELPGFSFLEVRPETGRTHQIRVHLQSIGHAVVGDARYGGAAWRGVQDPLKRNALKSFDRLALHAWKLSFRHPASEERVAFKSPLPAEIRALMETLRR